MSQMSLLLNASNDTKTSDQTGFLSDQNLSLQGRSQGGGGGGSGVPVTPYPLRNPGYAPALV